jgi:hypothetical protein
MQAQKDIMEIVIKDCLPIESYFAMFKSIWNKPVPNSFLLNMEGVFEIDKNLLGFCILLRQYASENNVKIELIKYQDIQPTQLSSLLFELEGICHK